MIAMAFDLVAGNWSHVCNVKASFQFQARDFPRKFAGIDDVVIHRTAYKSATWILLVQT